MIKSKLFIQSFGNPKNSAILFLHGFMGSHRDWLCIIELLKNDFFCIAIDLPGHGKSKNKLAPKNFTIDAVAKAVIKAMDQLHITRLHLLGYSMGGRLALYIALKFSEKIASVVLESSSPGLENDSYRKKRIQHDAELAEKLTSINYLDFLQQWYQQKIFSETRNHAQFQSLIQSRLSNDPLALSVCLRMMGSGSQPSLWDKLPDLKKPLMLIVGEYDKKFQNIARKMQIANPGFQIRTIKKSDHIPHFHAPEFVSNIIKNFFLGVLS